MATTTTADLVVLSDSASPRAEAYRVLRARLRAGADASPSSILITSPTAREDRHGMAANLALAMAEAGERVILIDGDLREPRLRDMLSLSTEHGLAEALTGDGTAELEYAPGPMPGLVVLTAGNPTGASSALLARPALAEIVSALTAAGASVVIAGPPVLGAADASVIGAAVDGVVLATASYRTTRAQVREAVTQLEGAAARVLGVVLDEVGA